MTIDIVGWRRQTLAAKVGAAMLFLINFAAGTPRRQSVNTKESWSAVSHRFSRRSSNYSKPSNDRSPINFATTDWIDVGLLF